MPLQILFLISYWFIFWQKFLRNPYLLSTSEIASTYFPFWLSMGRKWKAKDDIYYKYPASIPFLSMWYPPNVLFACISKLICIDKAFCLYIWFILGHYLLASFLAFKVMGLFGALTLTYAGYCIKPQTPSFVYTMCWIPGMFLPGFWGAFSLGMAILGGYWPILIYMLPCLIFNPMAAFGLLVGLPQIIPFVGYWKRSVRYGEKINLSFGKLHLTKLKDLFWPTSSVSLVNGVHYPEAEMYVGIAILFIWKASWWWVVLCIALLISLGLLRPLQRIPMRSLYLATFCIALLSKSFGIKGNWEFLLLILQGYLLLRNSSIYPSFPFSQWWQRPSKIYPKSDYTGYLLGIKKNDYRGAFALKEAA